MDTIDLPNEVSVISVKDIEALNFVDQESAINFTELLISSSFNRIWTDEEGYPLPLPSFRLDWNDFDDFYAGSEKDLVHSLKDWLLD